jgi:hypothetical protein
MYLTSPLVLLTSAAFVAAKPIVLSHDDVVLYGKGHYKLMKRDDFDLLQQARNSSTPPPRPGYLDTTLFHGPPSATPAAAAAAPPRLRSLSKRADQTLIIKDAPQRFLGWDVAMSATVKGAPTTITVSSGYELQNSISVGSEATFSLVKDFLEASLSIDYGTSWTSSQSQQFQVEVPEGKFGALVSNPWTQRDSGHVFEGTVGSEGSLTYYQGDSFKDKEFAGLKWVDGAISLCTGDEFPLKRCLGEGTL